MPSTSRSGSTRTVESGIPANGYPLSGDVGGTPYTHPEYDPAAFWVRDLGVVVLDEDVQMPAYGELPSLDLLDGSKPSAHTTFTTVGYGYQSMYPAPAGWKNATERVRMLATPHLTQIGTGFSGPFSIMLSDNAASGGICSNDSGGPTLLADTNVVVAVNSFVMNPACGGTYGAFRVDRSWSLDWLYERFGANLP